jgi:hypothetical protein
LTIGVGDFSSMRNLAVAGGTTDADPKGRLARALTSPESAEIIDTIGVVALSI